jgi:hypothetical protein
MHEDRQLRRGERVAYALASVGGTATENAYKTTATAMPNGPTAVTEGAVSGRFRVTLRNCQISQCLLLRRTGKIVPDSRHAMSS